VLFCNGMERDEAAKSGLNVRLYDEYPWQDLLQEAGGDTALMAAMRLQRMFKGLGVSGRVGLYGHTDLSNMFAILGHFQKLMPEVELVGESRENSLFMYAMETKDEAEVARIRAMGKITTEVVRLTAEYLTSCAVRTDEVLLDEAGAPLKLGDVKAKINLWLAERDAIPSEGFIFAIGSDAGVPHSQGNPDDLMRLGQTIVLTFTRRNRAAVILRFHAYLELGYATPEAQKLYDQVHKAYGKLVENLDLNAKFKDYQALACDIFEKDGHKTPRTDKAPLEGYVHSLGMVLA